MTPDGQDAAHGLAARFAGTPFSAAAMQHGLLTLSMHTAAQPLFPIYSITKVYVAVLVLQTIAAGRLTLESRLARFHPEIPAADAISVTHLLTHTSGLPDYAALPAYRQAVAAGERPWSYEAFARHTWGAGCLFPPGSGWAYSNPGYALLLDIVERAWQRSAQELLRTLITAPLGLEHTRWASTLDDPDLCPSDSTSLSPDGQPRAVKTHYDPGWVWHRLLVSNATDTVRFLDALLREAWLGAPLTRAMMRLEPVGGHHPPWQSPGYGLGLMGELAGPRGATYGHNGGGPGYAASAYHFARGGCTIAVIAASEDADAVLDAVFTLQRNLGS